MNLVRAELIKIRTTALWWIAAAVMVPLWVAAVAANWGTAAVTTGAGQDPELAAEQAEQLQAAAEPVNVAAGLYTSGQYMGVLLVLLLGALLMTNEFFHQTATTTFLVTPRRTAVVLAKFAAAVLVGLLFWLGTTVLNLIAVPFILDALNIGAQLGDAAVWRAIALNGLAFVLWAVVGVGAGVLIRSQLAATLTLSLLYVIGTSAAQLVFFLLSEYVASWFSNLQVLVPTIASQLMISGTELPGNPPQWVGAVVLIGYALVTGALGTAAMRRRDIN